MGALLRSFDCYVLATRGEGWGMPIIEAMACGLPVIATEWSAHLDFFHAGVGFPIEVERLVPAIARCPYYHGLRWAQPSYENLRQQLRKVYSDPLSARSIGRAAADHVSEHYTYQKAADKILKRLTAIA
jgi:glycosyltransferase involved in cell wall biosynthesis